MHWGLFGALRGFHRYIRIISQVHWGIYNTMGDIMSALGVSHNDTNIP